MSQHVNPPLGILPRFIFAMMVAVPIFFLLAMLGAAFLGAFHLFGIGGIGEAVLRPIRMFLFLLNYPLLCLLELSFHGSGGQDMERFAFTTWPLAAIYNCFLFALFCEISRFFIKQKKRIEVEPKPQVPALK